MKNNYEVQVYNAEVREALKNGNIHQDLEDKWSDTHYIAVRASSPEEAKIVCQRRHPEKLGFILGDVVEVY
ncbi:MAG: hypothetical protein HOH19_03940 [Kordiimonadaceae bacterium]|nr:hypothetical protein [Kordiimonadaceae bacterium]MBT6031703.1 hypothetical protein [Kordiimonadaceae bacterium]